MVYTGWWKLKFLYFFIAQLSGLSATPTQLLLAETNGLLSFNYDPDVNHVAYLEWINGSPGIWYAAGLGANGDPYGSKGWFTVSPQMNRESTWVIAQTVPEPSTFALLATAALGC